MSDLISVVLPTYNRNELLLGRALPSVLRQTHQNLEVLIVADGMEGRRLEDLEKGVRDLQFYTEIPLKLWNIPRPVYPEDPGQKWCVVGLWALNHGLDHARGDWIAAIADDDEWVDDAMESLLARQAETGADFVYGQSIVPKTGQMYGHWPPGAMNFTDGSYIYRRSLNYRYDPACIERGLPEDADLWLRMIADGVSFAFLKKVVYRYYPNRR